jgi:hypothetical protein
MDAKYQVTLLGHDIIAGASPRYWVIAMTREIGLEFLKQPLSLQGEIIAQHKLANMAQVIERHLSEQDRRHEARKSNKKVPGSRRSSGAPGLSDPN